jgi:predicted ATPase
MLSQLTVKNFRQLREITLCFEGGSPRIVIGPNSTGKSSLIEVLDFLATAAVDGLEKPVYRDRQGPADFMTAGRSEALSMAVDLTPEEDSASELGAAVIRYSCEIARAGSYVRVERESIETFPRGSASPSLALDRRGERSSLLNASTQELDKIHAPADALVLASVEQEELYPTLAGVRRALAAIRCYPGFLMAPSWGRDAREAGPSPRESAALIPVRSLDRRGLDLVNALYTIHTYHPQTWAEILRHFIEEFPQVERITFPPDPGGARLALGWNDRWHPGALLSAHHMSEGMLSFLALLTAILAPDRPTLLAFDEPDAHLHPSAIRRLVHVLEEASEKTSVLVVTHSSELLELLSDPAGSVLTCQSGPTGTRLESLDREALGAWLEEYSMTDLRNRGFLDSTNDDPSRESRSWP